MSLIIYKTEDLPERAHFSPYLMGQAKYFIQIQHQGLFYYLPVTKEMKRIFRLSIKDGKMIVPRSTTFDLDDFLRGLIDSVYLQVRDTVAAGIHATLSREIQEGFTKVFSENLFKVVSDNLNTKLTEIEYKPG
jgi:hypothetical protein